MGCGVGEGEIPNWESGSGIGTTLLSPLPNSKREVWQSAYPQYKKFFKCKVVVTLLFLLLFFYGRLDLRNGSVTLANQQTPKSRPPSIMALLAGNQGAKHRSL